MAKKNTIQERLIEWSDSYSDKVAKLPKTGWKFHRAAEWVARDILAAGAALDQKTWVKLEKVEKIFGRRLRKRVTHNLFNQFIK